MEKIIVANLKMNLKEEEVKKYNKVINSKNFKNIKLFIAPSFLYLNEFKSNNYNLTAQDISSFDNGDYTGEISGSQLKSIGVSSVIIGHNERRELFNEDDDIINKKVIKAISNNLKVILCIGNREYEDIEVVTKYLIDTLEKDLKNVEDYNNILIAYEPVYAINSDKSEEIDRINKIVSKLKTYFLSNKNTDIKIIYGGSVNDKNIGDIVKVCDGVIVGKNSLDVNKFVNMIEMVN